MRGAFVLLLALLLAGCTTPAMPIRPEMAHAEPLQPMPPDWPGERRWTPPPAMPHDLRVIPLDLDPAPEPTPPRSIAYNGGFEEGEAEDAAGWRLEGGAHRIADASRSAEHSLRLPAGANASQLVGGATPGSTAFARLYASGPGTVTLILTALDADLRILAEDRVDVAHGLGGWSEIRGGSIPLGADAAHLRLVIEARNGGPVDVDDVEIVLRSPREAPFRNGAFDQHDEAWTLRGDASIDCRIARSGCAARLSHSAVGSAEQRLTPPSDTGLVAAAFSQLTDAEPGVEPWLFVNWTFYDASGEVLGHEAQGAHATARGWVEVERDAVKVPVGTAEVAMALGTNAVGRGATWIDDVRLEWS